VVNTLVSINVVALHWAQLLLKMGDCLLTGKPSQYLINHLWSTQPPIPPG